MIPIHFAIKLISLNINCASWAIIPLEDWLPTDPVHQHSTLLKDIDDILNVQTTEVLVLVASQSIAFQLSIIKSLNNFV